jgi:hypothetical protein
MTRERKFLAVAALLAAASAATVIATRTEASEQGALSRVSNAGRTVDVSQSAFARQTGARRASLLAVRAGRAYYRLESDGTCFGTGSADALGDLGSVDCPRGPFPTSERPVLDLSVYEATIRGSRELSLYRAEGIAADGVSAIAFLRPNGQVALKVPVSRNVFSATSVPRGPIAGLAALDANDRELWRSP